MSTKLDGSKYCNVSRTIQEDISHLCTLNLNVHSLNAKQFYLTDR